MDDAGVVAWLADAFGLRTVSLAPVDGGADDGAVTWRALDDEGRAWAVKVSRSTRIGGLLMSGFLASQGVAGVPEVRPCSDGRACSQREGLRLSVVAWVDGPTVLDVGLDPAGWEAFGVLLAHVHRPMIDPGFVGLGRDHYDVKDVVALARRADAAAPTARDTDLAQAWEAARENALALADRTAVLAAQVRAQTGRPVVLTHTDPHQGNVIVDAEGLPWLLDWDDAMASDPERDLGFVLGGGIFTDAPISQTEQEAFLAGYRSVHSGYEPDPVRLEHHRAHRLLFDVADWTLRACDDRSPDEDRRRARRIALAHLRSLS